MGIFKKIKRIFSSSEDTSPLPESENFSSEGESFDPDKVLREMERELKEKGQFTKPERPQSGEKPDKKPRNRGDDLSGLFISDDDNIDTEKVRQSSIKEKQESVSHRSERESDSQKNTDTTESKKSDYTKKLDDLKKRAAATGSKVKKGMDDFLDDVQKKSDELDRTEREESERYSGPMDYRGKSLLDDKDDFFEKAKDFADGKPLKDEKPEITKSKSGEGKKKDTRRVYGFEDLDGDGDEIIDDAILEEE